MLFSVFFFFKQKTAYEMRISDWSSDVCSSDLYRHEDVAARVRELTDGKGVPVVYDGVGRDTFAGSLASLAPRGLLVSFGNASGAVEPFAPALLSAKGSLYLTRPKLGDYIATRAELQASAAALFDVVSSGVVRIEIGQT